MTDRYKRGDQRQPREAFTSQARHAAVEAVCNATPTLDAAERLQPILCPTVHPLKSNGHLRKQPLRGDSTSERCSHAQREQECKKMEMQKKRSSCTGPQTSGHTPRDTRKRIYSGLFSRKLHVERRRARRRMLLARVLRSCVEFWLLGHCALARCGSHRRALSDVITRSLLFSDIILTVHPPCYSVFSQRPCWVLPCRVRSG